MFIHNMGSQCSSCTLGWWEKPVNQRLIIDTEVRDPDWAAACITGKLTAVRILHAEEPDIIDQPVDEEGHTAIHIAVINQDHALLEYILNNGVNVNALGGPLRNTALHEAAQRQDMESIQILFAFGINDQITNIEARRAIELCPSRLRREFNRAKRLRKKNRALAVQANTLRGHDGRDTMIGGIVLNTASPGDLRRYIKESSGYMDFVKRKRKEIDRRESMLTAFGEAVGCEVDEIAFTVHQMPTKDKIACWEMFFHDRDSLTKLTDINRLMTALTKKAHHLRPHRKHKKPPQIPMHRLTGQIAKRLPKRVLSKAMFVNGSHEDDPDNHPDVLYSLLYRLHADAVREERPSMVSSMTKSMAEQYGECMTPQRIQY